MTRSQDMPNPSRDNATSKMASPSPPNPHQLDPKRLTLRDQRYVKACARLAIALLVIALVALKLKTDGGQLGPLTIDPEPLAASMIFGGIGSFFLLLAAGFIHLFLASSRRQLRTMIQDPATIVWDHYPKQDWEAFARREHRRNLWGPELELTFRSSNGQGGVAKKLTTIPIPPGREPEAQVILKTILEPILTQ